MQEYFDRVIDDDEVINKHKHKLHALWRKYIIYNLYNYFSDQILAFNFIYTLYVYLYIIYIF